ncbi:MAG: hypothetical protein E7329_01605 [Clostridiales bacterium]|nr:hypothetical protein [Clostridiales bacterium]
MMQSSFTLLDGAMGTMLQAAGLPAGAKPEIWNMTNPETVTAIQKKYIDAGSHVIYANTFGANRLKLQGSGYTVEEIIDAGVRAAKEAAGSQAKVALDIGPLGQLMAPMGSLQFEDAYDMFREMLVAGEKAGADLVIFETMSDLSEIKAAILAAREHTSLPIWATMTFEQSGRTFVGVSVAAMGLTLSSLGVEAMGFNCSLGPRQLLPLAKELAQYTDAPLILKPNAGLPDTATGAYAFTPQNFVEELTEAAQMGVHIFGGCCGSTPDYIAALKAALPEMPEKEKPKKEKDGVCSASIVESLDEMPRIGRSISPENPEAASAARDEDWDSLTDLAMEDTDEDAQVIQVHLPLDCESSLPQAIISLQAAVRQPLLLRAEDPDALTSALRAYNGRPMAAVTCPEALALCRHFGAVPVYIRKENDQETYSLVP